MMSKLITANRGFTLIEIISVLLVIGILSAVAISRMVFSHQDVDNTARVEKLKTQLRYAQSRAMNTDEIWGIEFSGTSYHLFNGGNVSNTVHLPGEDSVNISLPSGTSIVQSGTPVNMVRDQYRINQVMENIVADYKQKIKDGNLNLGSFPAAILSASYWANDVSISTAYVSYSDGDGNGVYDEATCSYGTGCKNLKITLSKGYQKITTLFTE